MHAVTPDGEPTRSRASRRGLAWALATAIALAAVGWGVSVHQQGVLEASAEDALEQRASAIEAAAATEAARYLDVVTIVADGLGSLDEITAAGFQGLTNRVERLGLDGATSIVYIAPPVATADVPEAQARWRRTFGEGLELQPADRASKHVFTLVTSSLDGAPDRPGGIDVAGAEAPYAALMESLRTGSATVSDAYELLIDQQLPPEERQTSFSLVAPVEQDGVSQGWVLLGLRGQDFLGHVLESAGQDVVGACLEAADVDGAMTPFAEIDRVGGMGTMYTARTVSVAQQDWTLRVEADPDVLTGPSRVMPRNALLAGALLGVLVAAMVWLAVSGRERSEIRVRRATADLAAAERTSRRQASLLDELLQTIDGVGVSVVDSSGRFVLQNRAAREILGVDDVQDAGDPDEAQDGHVGPAAAPEQPADWQSSFGVFHLDGTPMSHVEMPLFQALDGVSTDGFPMLIRNDRRPEGAQIEVAGRPLALDDGEVGGMAIFRDVTQERLQQAELAGFAGVVAHDLRHPLTVINGYVGLLVDDCLPALQGDPAVLAATASYLAKVNAGAARMAELIRDLLDYTTARDAEMTTTDVDLQALAEEVTATHLDVGGTGAHPPYLHVSGLPVVQGDPDRLRQLFANLIGNAVKYIAPGSIPLLDVSAEVDDERVRLRFADRGLGIPADKLADVFRPFVRAHTGTPEGLAYTGTGLGLAICQQVVQRHGGEITARTHRGGGSIFIVDLPLRRPGADRAGDPSPGTAEAQQVEPVQATV